MLAEALEKVRSGEIKNLVINMPPRYGKTELAVINFIAQSIAANPKARFIHLSYSDDLALDNSGRVRELIKSDWFQNFWPVELKDDADSKKKWYTEQGGGLYATAAGGPITGFGAGTTDQPDDGLFYGAIIIDDPHKVDDVDRDNARAAVTQRLNTTIKSRRNSRNTPIIIIMQRLHEDDMSGFVLNGLMGEEFTLLSLPAIYEGKPLWEFKHTMKELQQMKASDNRTFMAQYMQDPTPDDGTFFKREWFENRRYQLGAHPELCEFGASDFAVSEGKGDFTEQATAGFDEDEDLWFTDWWAGQTSSDVWVEQLLKMVQQREPVLWVAEGGLIRRSVEPFLKKEMRGQRYVRMEWINSNQNKAANCRSFQALAAQLKVHIPLTPWGDELIEQLIKFPAGKFDDKVDVCGLFGRILHESFGPREHTYVEAKKQSAYTGDEDDNEDEWKTT